VRKRYRLTAAREYEAGGETRTQWVNLGSMWYDDETEKLSGVLEVAPCGSWFDGRIHAFRADDDKGKRQQQKSEPSPPRDQRPAPKQSSDFDDEIPF